MISRARIATLEGYWRYALGTGRVSSAVLDVVEADVSAFGADFDRAIHVAGDAASRLQDDHPLKCRAHLIAGRAAMLSYRSRDAVRAYGAALARASTDADRSEAVHGAVLANLYLEEVSPEELYRRIESLPVGRPEDYLQRGITRVAISFQSDRVITDDPSASSSPALETNPSLRTAWAYTRGTALVLAGRYAEAEKCLRPTLGALDEFGLAFGVPHVSWALAAAEHGLRHFARCESLLRRIEQRSSFSHDPHMQMNVRALRARVQLSQGHASEAIETTRDTFSKRSSKAMFGEYVATRALALAVVGDDAGASSRPSC